MKNVKSAAWWAWLVAQLMLFSAGTSAVPLKENTAEIQHVVSIPG